ncbi:AI-2E family transporter [Kitasatospora xanthocidica]|uniref:AI-2E family transporter n=1 Tax=Kitasatospora xanthocidica TaxID=83382 RepID=A0A372ZZ38_9ACTN|nr:AI-2E family transporter [Kitasatospora xanthocidica]RGD61168.1 AI-2E family transporter [Kitasatospora xanthocidica]
MARGGKAFKAVAKGMAVVASAAAVIERRRRAAMAADPHEPALPALAEGPVPALVDGHVPALVEAPGPVPVPRAVPVPQADPAPAAEPVPPSAAPAPTAPVAQPAPAAPAAHVGLGREYHPGRPATPAEAVPWGLRVAAESTWRLLLLGAALYVVFYVVDMLRLVAFSVLASLLITALLEPSVSWLRRHGVPRSLAAGGVFLSGLAGIGLVGWFVVWQVSTNLSDVTTQVKTGVNQLRDWLVTGPLHLTQQQITDFANQITKAITTNTDQLTSASITGAQIAVEVLTALLMTFFTTFFFLYDGAKIWNWALRGLPRHSRFAMAGAGPKAWATLTAYVRGTVCVAFIDALCIGIGVDLLGVPLALPLAVIIFLGAFVPLVGALITGTVAVLIALVTQGPWTALMVLVVLVAVMQVESHILQPLILGRAVRVHPLGVVLGVAAGGIIGGIGGAVVAVPLIAVTNTVVAHLRRRNEAGQAVFTALEAAREAAERTAGRPAEPAAERTAAAHPAPSAAPATD